jgi:hypothetical protein
MQCGPDNNDNYKVQRRKFSQEKASRDHILSSNLLYSVHQSVSTAQLTIWNLCAPTSVTRPLGLSPDHQYRKRFNPTPSELSSSSYAPEKSTLRLCCRVRHRSPSTYDVSQMGLSVPTLSTLPKNSASCCPPCAIQPHDPNQPLDKTKSLFRDEKRCV